MSKTLFRELHSRLALMYADLQKYSDDTKYSAAIQTEVKEHIQYSIECVNYLLELLRIECINSETKLSILDSIRCRPRNYPYDLSYPK